MRTCIYYTILICISVTCLPSIGTHKVMVCTPTEFAKIIEQSNGEKLKVYLGCKDSDTDEPISGDTYAYDSSGDYVPLQQISEQTMKQHGEALKRFEKKQWGWWENGHAAYARSQLAHAKIVHYYVDSNREWIGFYDSNRPYYEFTNFARYPVQYAGRTWPTAEHAFQGAKFLHYNPDIAEQILRAKNPKQALQIARDNATKVRYDWHDKGQTPGYKNTVMHDVVFAKFDQNKTLQALLLNTKNAYLEEFAPPDSEWGSGPDGQGQNKLGKILMQVREELAAKKSPAIEKTPISSSPTIAQSLDQFYTQLTLMQLVVQ